MSGNDELTWLDATAQAELVAKGVVTPAELAEAAIARIERLNPQLNCVIFARYDKARAEARDRNAIPDGVFRGVPFLMKDLLQTTEGEPFSWGWKPFRDAKMVAQSTSYVAAKFRAAGLITLAQSTVPEWGATLSTETRAWGATRNPWNTTRIAGGFERRCGRRGRLGHRGDCARQRRRRLGSDSGFLLRAGRAQGLARPDLARARARRILARAV